MLAAATGGRRVTQALLAARDYCVENERGVGRKDLSKAAREAEQAFEFRPTARIVLKELVSCWGEQNFDGRLMVWPSNDHLMSRTGLSERAIRNAIGLLVEMRLIAPRDSANGKRFAIKNQKGEVIDAYGFDLAPLFERQAEFVAINSQKRQKRERRKRLWDTLTIARRAAQEAMVSLLEHEHAKDADALTDDLSALLAATPKRSVEVDLEGLLDRWQKLRLKIEQSFKSAGYAGISCRHIETDNEIPSESCSKGLSRKAEPVRQIERNETISLALVQDSCPALSEFGVKVRDISELIAAGKFLRGMIGAHESAWLEATERIGAAKAALTVVYVMQMHADDTASGAHRIRNPGGYFRALTRMIEERRFNLETEFHALNRRRS
jgi:replication initiation protein RepC